MTRTLDVDAFMLKPEHEQVAVRAWLAAHECPDVRCFQIDINGDIATVHLYRYEHGKLMVRGNDLVAYTVDFLMLQPFPLSLEEPA